MLLEKAPHPFTHEATISRECLLLEALEHDPRDLEAALELVQLLMSEGRFSEAEQVARGAVRQRPAAPIAHYMLGWSLVKDRPHTAIWHLERAMELAGERDPMALMRLATARLHTGDVDGARVILEGLVKAFPRAPGPLLRLAHVEEKGRNITAVAALLDRLEVLPLSPGVAGLAQVRRAEALTQAGDLQGAVAILGRVELEGHDAALARLHHARLLQRLGEHDAAFKIMSEAKRDLMALSGRPYEAERAQAEADASLGFFTASNMALLPRADVRQDCPQPIFVVGFPRSGTTMIEQALTTLPAIAGGGEMLHMADLSSRCAGILGSLLPYPEALSELWLADHRNEANLLRDFYLGRVKQDGTASSDQTHFVDKRNDNEWHIGLITLLFPDAPIIRMVRHPLDVVMSALSFDLDYGFTFANSLETAARHYALVSDTTDALLARFPSRVLTVRYEDLIGRQEETMRRVLEHVGVPFDPRCLAFHENRRYGHTESYAQVAEPLYTRARGRYRHYLRHLQPVLPVLEGTMERMSYEV